MGSIIVAMPRIEDARKISDILRMRGMTSIELCTTGAGILEKAHRLDSGIVICARNFKDMYCNEIAESLPNFFDMLLLTSKEGVEQCPSDVVIITMPFHPSDLLSSVEMLLMQQERRIRREKKKPKERSAEEKSYIDDAKKLLMDRNHMSEEEAFRYIQKCSMDSSTNMVETARMIILLQVDL